MGHFFPPTHHQAPFRAKDANHGPTRPKNPMPHAHWILNILSMLSIHIAPIYLNIRISPLHRLGNIRHDRQEESSTSILC
jgi:hypothetical protein